MKILNLFRMAGALALLAGCSSAPPQGGVANNFSTETGGSPFLASSEKAPAADLKLGDEVRQLLMADRSLAPPPSHLMAMAHEGVVTLRGTVPSRDNQRDLIERIAQLPGVTRVEDQLRVR